MREKETESRRKCVMLRFIYTPIAFRFGSPDTTVLLRPAAVWI